MALVVVKFFVCFFFPCLHLTIQKRFPPVWDRLLTWRSKSWKHAICAHFKNKKNTTTTLGQSAIRMSLKHQEFVANPVAGVWPLSAGAELKCRDRVLGKGGKKIALLLCQAKEGPQQADALKTLPTPHLRKNCEFYNKKGEKQVFR